MAGAGWMNTSTKEALISIDIAHASDHGLIQQKRFDRTCTPRYFGRQVIDIKGGGKRFLTQLV